MYGIGGRLVLLQVSRMPPRSPFHPPIPPRTGIKGIVFDKDNTLCRPFALEIDPDLKASVEECRAAFGGRVAIYSNSAGLQQYDPEGGQRLQLGAIAVAVADEEDEVYTLVVDSAMQSGRLSPCRQSTNNHQTGVGMDKA